MSTGRVQSSPNETSLLDLFGVGDDLRKLGARVAAQAKQIVGQIEDSGRPLSAEAFKKLTGEVNQAGGNIAGLDARGILKTEGKTGKETLEKVKSQIGETFKNDFHSSDPAMNLRRGTRAFNDAALSFLLEKTGFSLLPPQEQIDFLKTKVIRTHPKAWVSPEEQLKELQTTRMDWVLRNSSQRLGQGVKLQAVEKRSQAGFEDLAGNPKGALLNYAFSARLYRSASQIDSPNTLLKQETAEAFALWAHQDSNPENKAKNYRNAQKNIDFVLSQDPQAWRAYRLQADIHSALGKPEAASKISEQAFQVFLERFDSTLHRFQVATTHDPVEAHRHLQALKGQLKEGEGIPLSSGEQKLAILKRTRQYFQGAGDFSRQLEVTPEGTFFPKDWAMQVQTHLSGSDRELRNLRGQLNEQLSFQPGRTIDAEQISAARLAFQVEAELGDAGAQVANLERWTSLLSQVSASEVSAQNRLAGQIQIFKEWTRLRELPEASKKFPMAARLKTLAHEISQAPAIASDPAVQSSVLALLEQAMNANDPRALEFVHPERLLPYANEFLQAQEKFSSLEKIAEPKARRSALLHSLQEFAGLRSPAKVQEVMKRLEATLSVEPTHYDRLGLISQIGQVLRGSGLSQEESNREAGLKILKEFSDPKLPNSERAQGLLAGKNFFQATDDKKAIEKNNKALRHLYVELRNDLLFHDTENEKARLSDPSQRVEAAFLAQKIQISLVEEDMSSAAAQGVPANLTSILLSGVQMVREEVAKADELPLATRLEYLAKLSGNLALLGPLSQGAKPAIQAEVFQKEQQALAQNIRDLIQQDLAIFEKSVSQLSLEKRIEKVQELGEATALLSSLNPSGQETLHAALSKSVWGLLESQLGVLTYGGTIAAGSVQEALASEALARFEKQGADALSQGNAGFFRQLNPQTLTTFLKHNVDAGLLLIDGEGKKGPEQIKRRLQAASLYAQAGLPEKVEETLASALVMVRELKDLKEKGGGLFTIATLLQSSGLVHHATGVFEEIAALDQKNNAAPVRELGQLAKGIILLNEGDVEKAKAVFKGIAQNPLAQRYLATLEGSEKLQRGLQGLQAISAVVNDLQQLIKEKGGRKEVGVSKEFGLALERARRQVGSGNYVNFAEVLKTSGLENLLERNAHLLKSFVLEKGRNSWELTTLFLKQIDNPKLSQKELARAGLQLAKAFLQANRFGPAGEIIGLLQNDPTVGVEAKNIFDSLPEMQRDHALWTTLKNATVIGAEDTGEALKNAVLLLAGFGVGRVLALGAKAAYVAHTVRLAAAAPHAFQAGRWFVGAAAEGLGFSTVNTLGQWALFDKSDQLTAKHFMKEWGAMVVTFGLLHGMGGQVQALRAAAGEWGKKGAGKALLGAADYASRVGGFMIADVANEYGTGLKDKQDIDIWMRLLNSAISDAHMIGAHKLGNKISRGKLDKAAANEEIRARVTPALAKLKINFDSKAGQALTAQLSQYSEQYQAKHREILSSVELQKRVVAADVRAQKTLKASEISPDHSNHEALRVLILKSHFEPKGKPITSAKGLREAIAKLALQPEVLDLSNLPSGQREQVAQTLAAVLQTEDALTRQVLTQAIMEGKIGPDLAERIKNKEVALQVLETENGYELNLAAAVQVKSPPKVIPADHQRAIPPAEVIGPAPQRSQGIPHNEIQLRSLANHLGVEVTPAFVEQLNAILPQVRATQETLQRVYSCLEPYLQSVNSLELAAVRREIFLQIAEGNIKLETAQTLAEQIVAGKVRLGLPDKANSVPIFKVPPQEQAEARKQAALNIAMGSTELDRGNQNALTKLYRDLSESLEQGLLRPEDLLALAGIGLSARDMMRLEDKFGLQSEWAFRLAENPVGTAAILRNAQAVSKLLTRPDLGLFLPKASPVATSAQKGQALTPPPSPLNRFERAALYQDFLADQAFVASVKNAKGETEYFLCDAKGENRRAVDQSAYELFLDASTEKFLELKPEAEKEFEVQPEQIVESIDLAPKTLDQVTVEGIEVTPDQIVETKQFSWDEPALLALKIGFKEGQAEVLKSTGEGGKDVYQLYVSGKLRYEVGQEIFELYQQMKPREAATPSPAIIPLRPRKTDLTAIGPAEQAIQMAATPANAEKARAPLSSDGGEEGPAGRLHDLVGGAVMLGALSQAGDGIIIPVIAGAIFAFGAAQGYPRKALHVLREVKDYVGDFFQKWVSPHLPGAATRHAQIPGEKGVLPSGEIQLDKRFPQAVSLQALPKLAPPQRAGSSQADHSLYLEIQKWVNRFAAKDSFPHRDTMRLEELSKLPGSDMASRALVLLHRIRKSAAELVDPNPNSSEEKQETLREDLIKKVSQLKVLLKILQPALQPPKLSDFPETHRLNLLERADFAAEKIFWDVSFKESHAELYRLSLVVDAAREKIPELKDAITRQEAALKNSIPEARTNAEWKLIDLYQILEQTVQAVERCKTLSLDWKAVQAVWQDFSGPLFGMQIRLAAVESKAEVIEHLRPGDLPVRGREEFAQVAYSEETLASSGKAAVFTVYVQVKNTSEAKEILVNLQRVFLENQIFRPDPVDPHRRLLESKNDRGEKEENGLRLVFKGRKPFLELTRPNGEVLRIQVKVEVLPTSQAQYSPRRFEFPAISVAAAANPGDSAKARVPRESNTKPESETSEEVTGKHRLPLLRDMASLPLGLELFRELGDGALVAGAVGLAVSLSLVYRKSLANAFSEVTSWLRSSPNHAERRAEALTSHRLYADPVALPAFSAPYSSEVLAGGEQPIPYQVGTSGERVAKLGNPHGKPAEAHTLSVEDPTVAPEHARVTLRTDGRIILEDLSHYHPDDLLKIATHGTWVKENGQWRKLAPGEKSKIAAGQAFALGSVLSGAKSHFPGDSVLEAQGNLDSALVFTVESDGKTLRHWKDGNPPTPKTPPPAAKPVQSEPSPSQTSSHPWVESNQERMQLPAFEERGDSVILIEQDGRLEALPGYPGLEKDANALFVVKRLSDAYHLEMLRGVNRDGRRGTIVVEIDGKRERTPMASIGHSHRPIPAGKEIRLILNRGNGEEAPLTLYLPEFSSTAAKAQKIPNASE